ncbi:MAG: D-alanine--D-alanine ligase [SAR324 cluster bacterium]|nr:D-alanine--D-alanine ligase [SAR324 cluster bacterium]
MIPSSKKKIGLICGGQSLEHDVDLFALKEVEAAFDCDPYETLVLGIDRSGSWHFGHHSGELLIDVNNRQQLNLSAPIVFPTSQGKLIARDTGQCLAQADLFFSLADDPIQAFLRSLDVPYIGSDIYGTSIGRDKDVTKRLLRDHGFPTIPYLVLRSRQTISFQEIKQQLGTPLFIKPCRLGSSIGIHKVEAEAQFDRALVDAFQYDRKVIVEQAIQGREIECAVLGNDNPVASKALGEIINLKNFFTFEAKYLNENEGQLKIPAELDEHLAQQIRDTAVAAFTLLECEGLARVDFFLRPDNSFIILEINTSPGLAKGLMYPSLWEASNVSYSELLDKLVNLGIERYDQEKQLKTSPNGAAF